MLRRLKHKKFLGMTPGDWALYVLLCVASYVPYLFDALHDILPDGVEIPVGLLRVVFMIGFIAIGVVYRHQIRSNRKGIETEIANLRDERARLATQQILEIATKSIEASSGAKYRANIMLIEDDKLIIRCHYQMNDAPDLAVELGKNQGCAGQAWGSGQQMCADLQRAQQVGSPSWNLPPDLCVLTGHLGAVLSTPIFDPGNPEKVLGIFNVDSELPLQEAGFLDMAISELAAHHASLFGAWVSDILPIGED